MSTEAIPDGLRCRPTPEEYARTAAVALWSSGLIGASQIDTAAATVAIYTRDVRDVERERCWRKAEAVASAIAGRVNDENVELLFKLPEDIREGVE